MYRTFTDVDIESIKTKYLAAVSAAESSLTDAEQAIKELGRKIDQYSPFYPLSTDYGAKLKSMLSIFHNAAHDTSGTNYTMPSKLRSYEKWSTDVSAYTGEGIYNLALIYIAQEIGMAANDYILNDDGSLFRKKFISIFNYALTDSIEKRLWASEAFDSRFSAVMNAQVILKDTYGLEAVENANYEKANTMLKALVPDLEEFDNIDISGIVSGSILIDSDQFNKLGYYCENIFIRWIFENDDWYSAIVKLNNLFNTVGLNFRTVLLKRFFEDSVIDICNNSETEEQDKLNVIIEKFYSSSASEGSRVRNTDDTISKYQAVYVFLYSQSNYMLDYFGTDSAVGLAAYKTMVPDDVGESYISKKKDESSVVENIFNAFTSFWNAVSDAFKSITNKFLYYTGN